MLILFGGALHVAIAHAQNSTFIQPATNEVESDQAASGASTQDLSNGTSTAVGSEPSDSAPVDEPAPANQTSVSSNSTSQNSMQSTNSTAAGNGTNATQSTGYNNVTETTQAGENNPAINSTSQLSQSTPADFRIKMDPFTASIEAGSSIVFTVTIHSLHDFNSDVLLVIKSASPGITASLSSNVTRPVANGLSTSLLLVQSDVNAPEGKYKVRVAGFAANISDSKSASATIELTKSNHSSLEKQEEFDPVAFTPIVLKNLQGEIIEEVASNEMILLSTTLNNNYDRMQPFVSIIEIRDKDTHATLELQLQKGVLYPSGQIDLAASWTPDSTGTFEIRSFVIDQLKDPQPLSAIVGRTVHVDVEGISDYDIIKEILKRQQ